MLYIRLLTPSVITIIIIIIIIIIVIQRAKKVVSNSPGLVDFAIGLVNSVWIILRNSTYRRTVKPILFIKKFWGLVEMMFGLVNVSVSLPEWQAVKMTFFASCYSHHHHFNHTVIIFIVVLLVIIIFIIIIIIIIITIPNHAVIITTTFKILIISVFFVTIRRSTLHINSLFSLPVNIYDQVCFFMFVCLFYNSCVLKKSTHKEELHGHCTVAFFKGGFLVVVVYCNLYRILFSE